MNNHLSVARCQSFLMTSFFWVIVEALSAVDTTVVRIYRFMAIFREDNRCQDIRSGPR